MSNENLMSKRWAIAIAGVVIMTILGTVYAWSVFVKPITELPYGWDKASVAVVFMIIIGMIGLSAAFGGILVDKKGPKFVCTLGVIMYGIGVLLGGVALNAGNIWLLYIGYGVIGGAGNGLAYVVPIATLIRWFPDKRGLITGMSVMGFGLGAFFIGKIVPGLINKHGRCECILCPWCRLSGRQHTGCHGSPQSPCRLAARWIHSFGLDSFRC